MKTILFVHHASELYGSDKMLFFIATGIDKSRFRPIVGLPDEGPLRTELQKKGIETFILPPAKISRSVLTPIGLLRYPFQILSAIWTFNRKLQGRRIEIVHSNTLAVLSGAIWAWLRGIPHIWHVHEIIEHPAVARKGFPLLVSLLADRVAAISYAVGDFLSNGHPYLQKITTVIWNGLPEGKPPSDSSLNEFRKQIGAGNDEVVVALVGRINRWKGQILFIEAAELLADRQFSNVIFVMVGGPPPGQDHFREKLQARINASPIKNRLKLLGFLENIRVVWDACDIGVVPSTEPEPFGIVALEAMAAAKPVIAADHGGLSEIVKHAQTGLLFQPNSAEDLANKLSTLISDEAKRQQYGARGRKRFETVFGVNRFVNAFEELYESI